MVSEKDTESRYSRTEINMKVHGLGIKLMEKENSGTQMVTTMKDFGSMTKLTGKDFIHLPMVLVISVNGKTICSMGMVKKPGLINHHMKVNIF
jgi:hypothetical protein